ncbi:MAG: formylglycine-generating enzyme family protein [Anaerolinea sp.]|nr:formylglycine-generating enzyme family protein [Anaerolinea sp.]
MKKFTVWVAFLTILTVLFFFYPLPSINPYIDSDSFTLAQGMTPSLVPTVTINTNWTPVEKDFNDVIMVLGPLGCFEMGSKNGEDDERPPHKVCITTSFWIDKYEVTNEQFDRLGGFAGRQSTWPDPKRPRERITWNEAMDFCALREGRLPTEAEWEYAARGPSGLVFPWGNQFVPNNAVYGGDKTGTKRTEEVGSHSSGVSWVGAQDMGGNIREWVTDWYDEKYYASSPTNDPQGPAKGTTRGLRGGSWRSDESALRATNRGADKPDAEYYNVGFRCVRLVN